MYIMLDLSAAGVTSWLEAVQPVRTDKDWPPAIRSIETSPKAVELLEELGRTFGLNQATANVEDLVDISDAVLVASMRAVLAQLGGARALKIISALADTVPSDAMVSIKRDLRDMRTAEGRALAAALDALAQTTLRGRITAEHRIATLTQAVEQLDNGEAS